MKPLQTKEWAADNCYTLARREIRRLSSEQSPSGTGNTPVTTAIATWEHVIRICEQAGCCGSGVLREAFLLNGWRELGEEMERIVQFMSEAQREDLLPDWFVPRLRKMLAP